jgi:hypothetical protein
VQKKIKMRWVFVFLGIVLVFSSCGREKQIAAHVYDKKLTREELQDMIPIFDPSADSVEIQQQYIDAWIVRQVMLHEAEQNLSFNEKKFDKQLQEYREALLIDAYENKRIKQLLDTVVSPKEIMDYYTANKQYFAAKKAIVKVNYIKLPLNFPQLEAVKKILFKNERSQQETEKLNAVCKSAALNFYMSNDWLLFDDILKEIPIATYSNNELFLEKNKTLELKDASEVYLVNFLSYKMDEKTVPEEADKELIIRSILQQRKIELLKTLRKNAVRKAEEAGEVLLN